MMMPRGTKSQVSKDEPETSSRPGPEPIAVIGIGCRYPGASNPEELWANLLARKDSIGPYRGGRFAALDRVYEQARQKPGRLFTDRGGFLQDVAGFDSQFFEISPRESIYLDPQHRLLLEVAYEALEDAGQVRKDYEGSATGVYTGLWTNEYEARLYESATENDFYAVTGCARASASGRLSFTFGFEGPSITIDTACSSSLVAVHMACQGLWTGEIDMALAGGANVILGSEISELFTKAKMLSPDGLCKFGDASANGFVRSEGAGIVVLKRLSRAIADNDPIYALLRGSSVNNDGRSSGLLVTPSRLGQQEMLRKAWQLAGVAPKDIRYIEMHGTGTGVGDPVEVEAVGNALAKFGVTQSCALGSIKTNIGHTESAAGVAGLIKAALALKHRTIPPSLHFNVPNPKIGWADIPVHVTSEALDLSQEPGQLLAGVNSFGITGTNAHVVLEEAPREAGETSSGNGPYCLTVSARSPEALEVLLRSHHTDMVNAGIRYPIRDVCYTASVRRTHHEHRVAIIGNDLDELRINLAAVIGGAESDGVVRDRVGTDAKRVVFVCPGQGSQWLGMARELFEHDPVFRRSFEQCDSAIAVETGWRLSERVLGTDAATYLSQIDVVQPALFTMSVALAAVWRARGVEPEAVVGHSMGEVAAAHIAGVLSLQNAVAVICRRSCLMKTLKTFGSMATVELPMRDVEALLRSTNGSLSAAASNGPNTTVISGDGKALEELLCTLQARDIYCRQIKVDVASHSAQVDPILDELYAALSGLEPQPAQIPMLSTVTGNYVSEESENGVAMRAEYWVQNLRRCVLFSTAIQKLSRDGHNVFLELSPHPILLPSIQASARAVDPGAMAIASLRRAKPERITLLQGLAALYVSGLAIDWQLLYPEGARCVRLPQYPFQRERCWLEPVDRSRTQATLDTEEASPLLGGRFESSLSPQTILWECRLEIAGLPYLNDHRVLHSAVFPAAGYVEMVLSAGRALEPSEAFEVCNAQFLSAAYLPETGTRIFQLALTPETSGGFDYAIQSRSEQGETTWTLHSKGLLRRTGTGSTRFEDGTNALSVDDLKTRYQTHRDAEAHYRMTAKSGLQYGPMFRLIEEAWVGVNESLCRLRGSSQDNTQHVIHPAILDACFQSVLQVRPDDKGFDSEDTYLPVAIKRVRMHRAITTVDLFAQSKLVSTDWKKGMFRTDIRLLDVDGKVLMDVQGMDVMRVARGEEASAAEMLHSLQWVEQEKAEVSVPLSSNVSSGNWILFADAVGIAETMKESLRFSGGRCTVVVPGSEFVRIDEATFAVSLGSQKDVDQLFESIAVSTGVPTAVVYLWSLTDAAPEYFEADSLMNAQAKGSEQIPSIVRAITNANWQNPPRLWLVTGGAMQVSTHKQLVRIDSAPLWGVGRMVAREHPELQATLVDLSSLPDPIEARALTHRIGTDEKEDQIALRGTTMYTLRLVPFTGRKPNPAAKELAEAENYRIEIAPTGILDNLELRTYNYLAPQAGEVGLAVVAAGLNFIDVTKAMGIYPGIDPDEPIRLGIECVGRVTALGAGASGFSYGEEVIAVTPSARTTSLMASSVCIPVELVVSKPAQLSLVEAATTSAAYLTAYYSLIILARIRREDWVLIHAGAGGVGLAAISIAKWAKANIIATVGSEEKAEYLRSLGVHHILDSRSATFAPGVMKITNGRGVDIVLNSLVGELQSKGLEVLAPYGRFIELGKRDIYDDRHIGQKIFRKNVSFHAVDLAAAFEEKRAYVGELLRDVMRHVASGEWRPLPVQSFSSKDPSVPFRHMAQARHIGRIAITMDRNVFAFENKEQPLFSNKATYLITGGLGGIGLTVAKWMAENGAGHLVLVSRRAASDETTTAIRKIESHGTTVSTLQADITQLGEVEDVIQSIRESEYPLEGVMHAAAVVDDALISQLSPERFPAVLAPKLAGTWNLHTATLNEDLNFFVLFSSIAAVHPQPGMGSYAAGNAFLDAFAHYRRTLGKPAITVNWGGWNELGLAKAAGTMRSLQGYGKQGMRNMSGREALNALKHVLETNPVQAVAIPFDADKFVTFHGSNGIPPIFSGLVAQTHTANGSSSSRSAILELLENTDSTKQRHERVESYLQEVLGRVLKLATSKIDRERAFGSMGLDSLMGLEFVRRLSGALQVAIPATVVFNYPTILLLADHLLRRMQLEPAEEAAAVAGKLTLVHAGQESSNELIDDLSEEDALQALIGNTRGSA